MVKGCERLVIGKGPTRSTCMFKTLLFGTSMACLHMHNHLTACAVLAISTPRWCLASCLSLQIWSNQAYISCSEAMIPGLGILGRVSKMTFLWQCRSRGCGASLETKLRPRCRCSTHKQEDEGLGRNAVLSPVLPSWWGHLPVCPWLPESYLNNNNNRNDNKYI